MEEFYRITNKTLMDDFRAALSQHTPGLLKLYRARSTAFPPAMNKLLEKLDNEVSFRHNTISLDIMGK